MVTWEYMGKEVSEKPPKATMFGFIYRIDYTNKKSYIGKKQFFSNRRVPLGKKELELLTDKRASKFKQVVKENDWRGYVGSSKVTKGFVVEKKTILEICYDKLNLTYCEQKHLMRADVLVDEKYANDCIGGKFYSGKISKGR